MRIKFRDRILIFNSVLLIMGTLIILFSKEFLLGGMLLGYAMSGGLKLQRKRRN